MTEQEIRRTSIYQIRIEQWSGKKAELKTREALVNQYVQIHHPPLAAPKTMVVESAPVEARPKLKRYIND